LCVGVLVSLKYYLIEVSKARVVPQGSKLFAY
jgi:hypothetical protein